MELVISGERYIARSSYAEKDIPKAAGFRWDSAARCWWTGDTAVASKLARFASDECRQALEAVASKRAAAIGLSRANAVAAEVAATIPCPNGLAYLPFQQAGIAYAMGRPSTLIADQMGLGKTIQAIGVINASPEVKRALIVCPASLKLNWARELARWLTRPATIQVVNGTWPEAPAAGPEMSIQIVNYDLLVKHGAHLQAAPWDLLIADEAHLGKNPKAARSKALYAVRAGRKLLLTGTPIVNRPVELFPLINFLSPGEWPNFFAFARRYCLPGDAPVLMADWIERPIADVRIGDRVIGWSSEGGMQRRLCVATVQDTITKKDAPLQRVTLDDGTAFICTPDHRWLVGQAAEGNSHLAYQVARTGRKGGQGRGCATRIVRIGALPERRFAEDDAYRHGYLVGLFRGDGWASQTVIERTHPLQGRQDRWIDAHRVGVACKDAACIDRAECYLQSFGIAATRTERKDGLIALTCGNAPAYELLTRAPQESDAWWAGFLGGIYDAEGSGQVISQYLDHNPLTFQMICDALDRFTCPYTVAKDQRGIRMTGGRAALRRFWSFAAPALTRKFVAYCLNGGGKFMADARYVERIEPLPGIHTTYTLTTSTGNYVAYGLASKNCGAVKGRFGWDFSGATNLPELQEKLRSTLMVRRLKADVLTELPAKRRQVIEVPAPDAGARRAIKAELAAYQAQESRLDSLRVAVELAKASDDPAEYEWAVAALGAGAREAFTELSRVRHETALAKLPAVIEHLTEALDAGNGDAKVVVFGHHHDVIAGIESALRDAGVGVVTLTGETCLPARQAAVDAFQTDPAVKVFLGSITAAGVGLTLTASAHVVFAELDWVPGNVSQAEDRTHRIGQTQSVLIQHLVLEGSLDVRMAHVLVEKQRVMDAALDALPEPPAPVTAADAKSATATETRDAIGTMAAKMTPAARLAVHECLRLLAGLDPDRAGELNDAGYNKVDGPVGHSLAERPSLSPRQAALGRKIVCKYHRQLPSELLATAKEIIASAD